MRGCLFYQQILQNGQLIGEGGGVQKPKAYFANEFINLLQMITEWHLT